jgi:cohesin complex subunit SA-1/2
VSRTFVKERPLKRPDALLSPDIALQPLVEEWVETYQETAGDEAAERTSVHELVLFFIRCAGLNSALDEDQAMDVDGIQDMVDDIQSESVVSVVLRARPC